MKKNIFTILIIAGTGLALTFTGCSKDDATAPVVTLIGDESIELSLNYGGVPTWTDLGATANDDEDGEITVVTSDASSTNPNVNLVGFYTITYSATDKAGNIGTATRSIYVKNDADDYAGTYMVEDTVDFDSTYVYPQEITVDESINNRIHFSRFADFNNNTTIYATKLPNGNIEIPLQTAANIGSGTDTCAIASHQFSSIAPSTLLSNGFSIRYTDTKVAPCNGTATGTAIYTRQ